MALVVLAAGCSGAPVGPRAADHRDLAGSPPVPVCAVAMTAPVVFMGDDGQLDECAAGDQDGDLTLSFRQAQPAAEVNLRLARGFILPGQVVGLPMPSVFLWDAACSRWSGSLNWISDEPDWSIAIDGTCGDDASRRIVARFWGHGASDDAR